MSLNKDDEIGRGRAIAEVGWSYQLLLAVKATGPVKRFTVNQNQSWDVEFYESQPPLVAKENFKEPVTLASIKEST